MTPIEQALTAAQRAFNSPYSNFYRTLYEKRGVMEMPRTEPEWQALPFLTREDIAAVSLTNRLYIPWHELRFVRPTSGTSGKGVLCMPVGTLRTPAPQLFRGKYFFSFQYYAALLLDRGILDNKKVHIIQADPTRMDASARLAAQIGADSLHGLPSQLLTFGAYLKKQYDPERILCIETAGERLSTLQRFALQTMYPKAVLYERYATAETRIVATSATPPQAGILQVIPQYYVELIDAHGRVIDTEGREGEIVVTTLGEDDAFPLIRYRFGDVARLRKKDPLQLEILGRLANDRVRLGSGEINCAELERVVATLSGVVDFEATVTEELHEGVPVPRLSVRLYGAAIDIERCANVLSETLRINQQRTYQDAVEKGLCVPLHCELAQEQTSHAKRQHLTDKR